MIRLVLVLALVIPLAVAALPAAAQEPGRAEVQVLAGPCANCHGPDGRSPGAIPSIAGLDAGEAAARMLAFRDGRVPSATIMPRLMRGYDESQIRALARWFAGQGR